MSDGESSKSYTVSVRVEETSREVVPGRKVGMIINDPKLERTKRDVIAITVNSSDQHDAIYKAIRLLQTELPDKPISRQM